MQIATLSLYRFSRFATRAWVLGQMGAARLSLRGQAGLGTFKLCGTGTGEGFTPVPNFSVWGILATWDSTEAATRATKTAAPFSRWAAQSTECWTVILSALSARGRWAGTEPFSPGDDPGGGPLAVLTRATLRPSAIPRFWGAEPPISGAIGSNPDVLFKIGVGEVPWVQQATFSIWPDAASMTRFAHADGPHARAIRQVRDGGWFREELYARFRVVGTHGAWSDAPALFKSARPEAA
ncbi:spheroidene monooxygenase [Anianabacter salinae]|uniref:spheroidene monooxygenase n=1 Tax=Anianabacter salinae TaxID=2851023 RepID=UPI00225DE6EA|nr:spheroidene monooxygenase [Anianabacter salinae]MBV0914132.1 spheroidene monooxygenase [Anianabacter salinae]